MKTTLAALVLATAVPAAAATRPFSVHDMLAMDRISDPRVSPDGTQVVFTVRATDLEANRGRTDLWIASVDGTSVRRLTSHEAADSAGRFAPDGRSIYFLSSRGGSSQVFRLEMDGGEPLAVTNLPLDIDALEVAPGGRHLLFSMAVFPGKTPEETAKAHDLKKKAKATGLLYDRLLFRHWDTWADGTRNHLFSYDLASGRAVDLMAALDADTPSKPFGGSEEFTVSPDGQTVVFATRLAGREEAWSTNFDLYSVPVDGVAHPKKLTSNPAWDTQPRFSPDGKTLAWLAMARPGFEADRFDVVLRDLASLTERRFVVRVGEGADNDRSVAEMAWTADGAELLLTADHLGQHPILALDPATGKTRIVVGEGSAGSPQQIADGRILYTAHSLLGPAEIYTAASDGSDARRVTHTNDEKVAAARFGEPEQFTFTGATGATVHAWIVKPVDFDPALRYPVAFLIHGGPQGSFGNGFHYRWNPQAYAGAGYAAVMVDFTGSTGYGQAFTDRIRGDWGGAPYEDLVKGLDAALVRYPFLDGSRVAALGASYGGYMVNWIAGKSDRFRCLVSHDGNVDELTAYYMTEELWFPEWEHGGVPWQNPEAFSKQSPIHLVANWKTPTLVIHGGKDYRVVETQGMATFTALQRKGVPSRFLYFPDESHWVLKPANSILWHETVIAWLDQWTKPIQAR